MLLFLFLKPVPAIAASSGTVTATVQIRRPPGNTAPAATKLSLFKYFSTMSGGPAALDILAVNMFRFIL